jgi:hypothetical protein
LIIKESVFNLATEPNLKSRLVVLLPEQLAGNLDIARKINHLAARENADVLYLVSLLKAGGSLPVIRSMVTMKALTSDGEIVVGYQLVARSNWVKTLKELYRPQDMIVAPEELSELLGSNRSTILRNANRYYSLEHFQPSSHSHRETPKRHLF